MLFAAFPRVDADDLAAIFEGVFNEPDGASALEGADLQKRALAVELLKQLCPQRRAQENQSLVNLNPGPRLGDAEWVVCSLRWRAVRFALDAAFFNAVLFFINA